MVKVTTAAILLPFILFSFRFVLTISIAQNKRMRKAFFRIFLNYALPKGYDFAV